MKTKKNLIALMFVSSMMLPLFFNAQNLSQKEKTFTEFDDSWKPLKLDGKGNNVKNGVEFYNHTGTCNNVKTKVLKLINTNAFPVKVSYQVSPDSPVFNVMVPASVTIEGSCSITDGNLAKLVIVIPVEKNSEEKQKIKEYLRSHIEVNQLK